MISEKDWDWESNGESDGEWNLERMHGEWHPERAIKLVTFYEHQTYDCLYRHRFKIGEGFKNDEERETSSRFALRAMKVRKLYHFDEDDDARIEVLLKEYTKACYKARKARSENE